MQKIKIVVIQSHGYVTCYFIIIMLIRIQTIKAGQRFQKLILPERVKRGFESTWRALQGKVPYQRHSCGRHGQRIRWTGQRHREIPKNKKNLKILDCFLCVEGTWTGGKIITWKNLVLVSSQKTAKNLNVDSNASQKRTRVDYYLFYMVLSVLIWWIIPVGEYLRHAT